MAGRETLPGFELRALRPAERRLAAGLTARAMRDNPTTEAMFGPDPLDRLAGMQAIWTGFFHRPPRLALGGFYRGCLLAVGAAAAPGGCIGAAYGRTLPVAGGPDPPFGDPARAGQVRASYARHDLPAPHWHVGPVAVEPRFQGRGLGEALMRELQRRTDAAAGVLWGETDTEANVRFYRGLGWRVAGAVQVLGIPLWFLHRPAGQAASRSGTSARSSANGSSPSATLPMNSSASPGA
jgi:ribosomal protein S18 acetylase RimI-like enzyme